MDRYTYVEEEHWSLVATMTHMLRNVGDMRICGTQLEEEHLA
jgi:hypothetical protein